MADVELTYKGTTIGSLSNTGTLTMETAGKYCEANIGLTYTKSGGGGGTDVSDTTATAGDVLSGTWFHIADGSYVQGTIPTNTSEDVTVSGKTVTVDSGYYATAVSKSVADGSATTPATTISVTPSVTVDSSTGVVTASVSGSQSVTPTVSSGYVSTGTAGTVSVSGSNTLSLSTAQGGTITPTESQQTAVAAGKYTLGAVTVDAISSTYVGSGIDRNDSTDLTVSGATVTAPAGYYASDASKSVASGVVTAPSIITASGATVTASFPDSFSLSTFNPVSVTPVVTTPGYVTAGTAGSTSITLSTTGIAVKSANTYTPGAAAQTIAAGTYLAGAQTISGDSNLTAANIKDGTSIFGVTGTFTDASTVSSGQTAATASQILSGYSAWVDGVEVQGSASGGGVSNTDAILVAIVSHGASASMTKQGVATPIEATEWGVAEDGTVDYALFVIPPSLFDAQNAWTVTATDSSGDTTETIIISTNKQYNLDLRSAFYLYKDGSTETTKSGGLRATKIRGNGTYSLDGTTNNVLTANATFSSGTYALAMLYWTVNKIDITDYDTLHIYLNSVVYTTGVNRLIPRFGILSAQPSPSDLGDNWFDAVGYLNSGDNLEYTLSLEDYSGEYYIGFGLGASTNAPSTSVMSRIWLD